MENHNEISDKLKNQWTSIAEYCKIESKSKQYDSDDLITESMTVEEIYKIKLKELIKKKMTLIIYYEI